LRYHCHGIEHYHQATLGLLADKGGSFRLQGDGELYTEFHSKIRNLLKPEDYEPFQSGSEPKWKTRFRWALKHMRQDGRVLWHGRGQYEITEPGRSYLSTTALPLELMIEEVEQLENGEWRVRYFSPDGSLAYEFGGRASDLTEDDFAA
jgi:Mrr N-terminal domain